jgi:D-3-phosphoglycerate dehydrogenase
VLSEAGYHNVENIKTALDPEELIEKIKDAHFIGIRSRTHLTRDILEKAEKLIAIGCFCIGTNQVDLEAARELGIPVFNTPGANANAVKELVICSLLLASRGILEGNAHVNNVINKEENMDYEKIAKRIEKDKAKFVGCEIEGKTLGVIGLGAIGGKVVNAALALGAQNDLAVAVVPGALRGVAQHRVGCLHLPELGSSRLLRADVLVGVVHEHQLAVGAADGSLVAIAREAQNIVVAAGRRGRHGVRGGRVLGPARARVGDRCVCLCRLIVPALAMRKCGDAL